MACTGCNEDKRAVRGRVWYEGGAVHDFDSPESWAALPRSVILCAKIFFADGTARNCSGTWYWVKICDAGFWTLAHSEDALDVLWERYPGASFKRGGWTSEPQIDWALREMAEWNGN